MTDYIIRGGRFQTAVYDLLKTGFSISWYDKWSQGAVITSKTNGDILDDWLRVTDKNDLELISKGKTDIGTNDDDDTDGSEPVIDVRPPVKGAATRTKFTCPECGLNAWAKPTASLICGDCSITLAPS